MRGRLVAASACFAALALVMAATGGDAEAKKKRKKPKKAKPAPAQVERQPAPEDEPAPAVTPDVQAAPAAAPGSDRRLDVDADADDDPAFRTTDPASRTTVNPPEPDDEADATVASLAAAADAQRAPTLIAAVAMAAGGRRFAYNDALTANLRGYQVPLAPLAAVDLAWYPRVARGAGLTVRYERAFALESETSDGSRVATTWDRLEAGARMRFRARRASGPVLAGAAAYGRHTFTFAEGNMFDDQLPDVAYQYLRLGGGALFPSGRWGFALDAAWLAVLSGGEVADRFSSGGAQGVDVRAAVTRRLGKSFEVRAGLDYARYFYNFDPEPGDRYVAGGALDEFLVFEVGLAYAR